MPTPTLGKTATAIALWTALASGLVAPAEARENGQRGNKLIGVSNEHLDWENVRAMRAAGFDGEPLVVERDAVHDDGTDQTILVSRVTIQQRTHSHFWRNFRG